MALQACMSPLVRWVDTWRRHWSGEQVLIAQLWRSSSLSRCAAHHEPNTTNAKYLPCETILVARLRDRGYINITLRRKATRKDVSWRRWAATCAVPQSLPIFVCPWPARRSVGAPCVTQPSALQNTTQMNGHIAVYPPARPVNHTWRDYRKQHSARSGFVLPCLSIMIQQEHRNAPPVRSANHSRRRQHSPSLITACTERITIVSTPHMSTSIFCVMGVSLKRGTANFGAYSFV